MSKRVIKIINVLLVLALLLTNIPVMAFAEENGGEYFPEDSVFYFQDDDLGSSGEEVIIPQDADSVVFADGDLNTSEEGLVEPEGSKTIMIGDDDLGAQEPEDGESGFLMENSNSANFIDTSTDVGVGGELQEEDFSEEDFVVSALNKETSDDLGAGGDAGIQTIASVAVGVGSSQSVTLTVGNTSEPVYMQYAISDSSICQAKWGNWSGRNIPITITAKKSGTTYIYLYLKGAHSGSTLGSARIYVQVPRLTASSSEISVSKGGAKKVTFTYACCDKTVYLQYRVTNDSLFSCGWGGWSGTSVPLTITGKNAGTAWVIVRLLESGSNRELALVNVKVTVQASPKLTLSASSVSLSAGASTQVKATYSNYSGVVYMSYSTSNTTAYSCKWGGWSGNTVPLNVTGNQQGSGTVYIYLRDANTNATLATASFSIYVNGNPKVTPSVSSVNIKAGESQTIRYTVEGVSCAVYLQFGQTNNSAMKCEWAGNWYNGGKCIDLKITGLNSGQGIVYVYLKNSSTNATMYTSQINVNVQSVSKPSMRLSTSSVKVNSGSTASVTVTFSNLTYDCYVQFGTTNSDAYSCKWGSQYGNTIQLYIEGLRQGEGRVTIYLRRSSNKELLDSASLSVSVVGSNVLNNISYSFANFSEAATLALCKFMYRETPAYTIYNYALGNGGNCFGLSTTAEMFYVSGNGIYPSQYRSGASVPSQLARGDYNSSIGLNIKQFIQAMMITQCASIYEEHEVYGSSLSRLVSTVSENMSKGIPTEVGIFGRYHNHNSGHSILACGVIDENTTRPKLLIYDCNYPMSTRYLTLTKNSSGTYTGWSYDLTSDTQWGNGKPNAGISYTLYSNHMRLWNNRGNLTTYRNNLLLSNSKNLTIRDVNDEIVARVEDGQLTVSSEGIHSVCLKNIDLDNEKGNPNYLLYLPVDLYTVHNDDPAIRKFVVELTNEELSSRIESDAGEVTLCADDSCNLASVLVDAEAGEAYNITLRSSREGDLAKQVWDGVGSGETVAVSLNNGVLESCNLETAFYSVNTPDEEPEQRTYKVIGIAGENGTVTPSGEEEIQEGSNRSYKIVPAKGYRIKGVLVDGVNVGRVSSYTFEDIRADHTIEAVFTKKSANTISAANITKTASAKVLTFSIGAKTKDGAKLTYKSDNRSVAVSKTGVVSIAKRFVGKAVITITAAETKNYKKTEKKISVTVKPTGTVITKVENLKGKKMKVSWKKNVLATGYQIRISTSPKFPSGAVKGVTVASNNSFVRTISNLTLKKKYYVQVRVYKTLNQVKYYSAWSATKSLTIKK